MHRYFIFKRKKHFFMGKMTVILAGALLLGAGNCGSTALCQEGVVSSPQLLGENTREQTLDYNACEEGLQKDGSYIIKISSKQMQDAGNALQNAFYEAKDYASKKKPYLVIVEPGNYTLSLSLHMYRYTTLYARGAVFTQKNHTGNMLKVGDVGQEGDNKKGYYYEDITVDGGTWNGNRTKKPIYRAAHCKNLLIQNAEFASCVNTHLMEVAALDGFTVRNCIFRDGYKTKSLANEAIQIDITEKKHFNAVAEEIIPSKNITIEGNTFKNVLRGVGSHTAWVGLPMTKVIIRNNTFTDVASVAIECLNYQDCLVEDNTLIRCGRGISIFSIHANANGMFNSGVKAGKTLNAKTIVRKNRISVQNTDSSSVSSGIAVQGALLKSDTKGDGDRIAKGNYMVSGVEIYGNTITTKAMGIILRDAAKITVKNNTVNADSKGENYGILSSDGSLGIKITGNAVKAKGTGIVIRTTKKTTVSKNKITGNNAKNRYGIWVTKDSKSIKLSSNTIKKYKIKIKK